jgi:hypothetical protein
MLTHKYTALHRSSEKSITRKALKNEFFYNDENMPLLRDFLIEAEGSTLLENMADALEAKIKMLRGYRKGYDGDTYKKQADGLRRLAKKLKGY